MNRKLIMCRGLPGSGKTTWAKRQVEYARSDHYLEVRKFVRVNKDDIRAELVKNEGWVWSPENEKRVEQIRDDRINGAFLAGVEVVISDDTNFAKKHRERLNELARLNRAQFEIREFTMVPLRTCIERDAARPNPVGEAVIRKMAAQYLPQLIEPPVLERYVRTEGSMKAVICDLDGTLALFKGRTPDEEDLRNPYDHAKCAGDWLNAPIRRIIEIYYRFMHYQIIYVSGREEKFREATNEFLRAHHCPPGPLLMRPNEDKRHDWIVKYEIFNREIRGLYDVEFVLDDRDRVVEMWRAIGLTCLQVAPGGF